ncbi:unnamed protein product [Urochloa decumbens]|uniref:DUF295 domain-containing protein n=1 Tax=Urochloa decumbens TaxID=240449 RepID=A0ABC9AW79_9POAL
MLSSKLARWCDIPVDPCEHIVRRLDVIDVLNFSSTCKSWEAICKNIKATILKSGKPMLITSQPDQDGSRVEVSLTGKFGIHDVSSLQSFLCDNQGLNSRSWIGGKDDWLVVTNSFLDVELLNPITGCSVPMPSFNSNHAGLKVRQMPSLSAFIPPFSRILCRVVLSRTPSHLDGYEAIALFSDGLLAYTAQEDNAWRVLKNPTDHDDDELNYYPEVFLDAVVHHGWVLAVEDDGSIIAWDVRGQNLLPVDLPAPIFPPSEESVERVFYLAISPADQLVLVCLYGHGNWPSPSMARMVRNEHDLFEHLDGMSIHEFDDANLEWRRILRLGHDTSLFVGLNYPFYVTSADLKGDSVYIADMVNFNVVICSMDNEGGVSIKRQDFPTDEMVHLLDGHSIRTPMWFRPTAPSRGHD